MLPVHPHDTCVVNHFGEDHDRVRSLHDLMHIVIEIVGQRGRTGGGTESEQAALAERPLLRIIESAEQRREQDVRAFAGLPRREPHVAPPPPPPPLMSST